MGGVNQPMGVPSLLLSPSLSPSLLPLSPSFLPEAGGRCAKVAGVGNSLTAKTSFGEDLVKIHPAIAEQSKEKK